MAWAQRSRVRLMALSCAHLSLSAIKYLRSRVRCKSRVRMESSYRANIGWESESSCVRIDWSVLENRKYFPGRSAAICPIRRCALGRPSTASTHKPNSSGAPEKISNVSSSTSPPHRKESRAFRWVKLYTKAQSAIQSNRLHQRKKKADPPLADPPPAANYSAATFEACRPLGPVVTSNSTAWPSFSDLYPSAAMAEKWTNTSSPDWRWMNPKPFAALNHFTVPCSFTLFLSSI